MNGRFPTPFNNRLTRVILSTETPIRLAPARGQTRQSAAIYEVEEILVGVDTLREEQAISRATDRLVQLYAGTHSAEHVRAVMEAARKRFDGFPIRDFVPILVERIAHGELAAQARAADEVVDLESPETAGDIPDSPEIHSPENDRPSRKPAALIRSKGFLSLAAAAVVVTAAVVVVVNVSQDDPPPPPPLTIVRGVIGSEKKAFFEDPRVQQALAGQGVKVEVESAGSRQIATSINLDRYDFAFPSSAPAGESIQRARHVNTKYTPFSSPMAIATFQPIVDVLAKAGVVKKGPVPTFSVDRYLGLVTSGTKWAQLSRNSAYPVDKNVLVSTTDPRTSNSAAMYLATASYVANGNAVVHGATAEKSVLPLMTQLFTSQGYTDNTSEGPFNEYLTVGMGPTPMVWIYEAQYVDAAARGRLKPGMALMYPSPTVLSQHTLVPLTPTGDRIGRLLSTDPELQGLAAEHGLRSGDATRFAKVAADHDVPVPKDLIDVVDIPSYDTLEHLLDGVAKSYG
ncbi:three-helix bundle dimerization domain-containing protein [Nonomuraea angiospora]|uniref:three-helix bundle dimerization domain-containing protein n=1 Tax=Nonomuraea angiospora TaxID=46172 RepID=UPI00379A72FE